VGNCYKLLSCLIAQIWRMARINSSRGTKPYKLCTRCLEPVLRHWELCDRCYRDTHGSEGRGTGRAAPVPRT